MFTYNKVVLNSDDEQVILPDLHVTISLVHFKDTETDIEVGAMVPTDLTMAPWDNKLAPNCHRE